MEELCLGALHSQHCGSPLLFHIIKSPQCLAGLAWWQKACLWQEHNKWGWKASSITSYRAAAMPHNV